MEQLTATSIISLFETTKEQRKSFADSVVTGIKDGNANALDVHIQVKKMEDTVKAILSNNDYMSLVLDETEKHGKSFTRSHSEISIRETGTKYDYSVCEDVVFNELSEKLEALQKEIKDRQSFLQNIPDGGIADPFNGNMIYKAAKSSTTSVTVKLK